MWREFTDFYDFLEIDPAAPQADVDEALQAKRRQASKDANAARQKVRQRGESDLELCRKAQAALGGEDRRADYNKKYAEYLQHRDHQPESKAAENSPPQQSATTEPVRTEPIRPWVAHAQTAMDIQDYKKVLEWTNQASEAEHDLPQRRFLRAIAHKNLGNLSVAAKEINVAIEQQPENTSFIALKANLCEMDENWAEALTAYHRCCALDPTNLTLWQKCIDMLYKMGQLEQVPIWIEKMRTDFPDQPHIDTIEARYLFGQLQKHVFGSWDDPKVYSEKDLQEARKLTDKGLALQFSGDEEKRNFQALAEGLQRMEELTWLNPLQAAFDVAHRARRSFDDESMGKIAYYVTLGGLIGGPLLLLLWGISSLTSVSTIFWGLVLLAACGGILYWYYTRLRVPRWKSLAIAHHKRAITNK